MQYVPTITSGTAQWIWGNFTKLSFEMLEFISNAIGLAIILITLAISPYTPAKMPMISLIYAHYSLN